MMTLLRLLLALTQDLELMFKLMFLLNQAVQLTQSQKQMDLFKFQYCLCCLAA